MDHVPLWALLKLFLDFGMSLARQIITWKREKALMALVEKDHQRPQLTDKPKKV
jgi:hypothetical protein